MTGEQYRAYFAESIKLGAQMMHDMAEDIAGKSDFMSNLTVTIDFDPEIGSIPKLTIERSHFPNHDQIDRLLDIRQKARGNDE
nr:MAG TPA: hypothetical protein [Caudoviricetes sp.]